MFLASSLLGWFWFWLLPRRIFSGLRVPRKLPPQHFRSFIFHAARRPSTRLLLLLHLAFDWIQWQPAAAAPQPTVSSQTSYLATALISAIISSRNGTTIASLPTASRFSRLFPIHHYQPQPFSLATPSECGRYLWIGWKRGRNRKGEIQF